MVDRREPHLTRREREVVILLCKGLKGHEIALRLGIVLKTVDFHRAAIKKKWRTGSLALQVRKAIRLGIIKP